MVLGKWGFIHAGNWCKSIKEKYLKGENINDRYASLSSHSGFYRIIRFFWLEICQIDAFF